MKRKMNHRIAAIAIAACSMLATCAFPASAYYNKSKITQREVLSPAYQSYFMMTEQSKFPAGKYWNHNIGHADEYSNKPCTSHATTASCGYVSNGVSVGVGITKLPDAETASYAYQCAGFARKLSMDFTGGGRGYVRMDLGKNTQLRVGDQLRIRCYGSNTSIYSDHSIFVTEVNGTSFKFADCNWNGTCQIRWNVNASIHNGALIINGKYYPTLYLERPLMAGDVNGDCVVDGTDISIIEKIANGTHNFRGSYEKFVRQIADVNNDGYVTSRDAWYIRYYYNGYPNYKLGYMTYLAD